MKKDILDGPLGCFAAIGLMVGVFMTTIIIIGKGFSTHREFLEETTRKALILSKYTETAGYYKAPSTNHYLEVRDEAGQILTVEVTKDAFKQATVNSYCVITDTKIVTNKGKVKAIEPVLRYKTEDEIYLIQE